MRYSTDLFPHGVEPDYRLDGRLFNLSRLKAKTKVMKTAVTDLQYADDCAILQMKLRTTARCQTSALFFLDPFQSAYRPHHITETALVRIHDDLISRRLIIAAFDTVDHAMLLLQMHSIGIQGPALARLTSCLSNRMLAIKIGNAIILSTTVMLWWAAGVSSWTPVVYYNTTCLLVRYSPIITLNITCSLTIRSCTRNSLVTNPAR